MPLRNPKEKHSRSSDPDHHLISTLLIKTLNLTKSLSKSSKIKFVSSKIQDYSSEEDKHKKTFESTKIHNKTKTRIHNLKANKPNKTIYGDQQDKILLNQ